DGFGKDGADIEIVAPGLEHGAHGLGEGLVPAGHVLDRLALGIARWQGADQSLLERRGVASAGERVLCGGIGRGERLELARRIEQMPGQVVVGAGGIGQTPMRHGAARVTLQRLAETFYAFFVIVGVDPDQAAVEPELRVGRCRGDRPAVAAEIVVAHVIPRENQGMTISRPLGPNRDNECPAAVPPDDGWSTTLLPSGSASPRRALRTAAAATSAGRAS